MIFVCPCGFRLSLVKHLESAPESRAAAVVVFCLYPLWLQLRWESVLATEVQAESRWCSPRPSLLKPTPFPWRLTFSLFRPRLSRARQTRSFAAQVALQRPNLAFGRSKSS